MLPVNLFMVIYGDLIDHVWKDGDQIQYLLFVINPSW